MSLEAARNWLATRQRELALALVGLLAFIGLTVGIYAMRIDGIDWRTTLRPVTLAMLNGQNPYNPSISPGAPYLSAPWGLIILAPLAILPVEIGRALLLAASLVLFAYVAWRLGAKPLIMALFVASPPVMHCLLNGNNEWMPLLGFVLPPQIGLFLVLIKPQSGGVVAIYWLVEAWREGGLRRVLVTFVPVSAALALSMAVYGLWPLHSSQVLSIASSFNASLWPESIPVGLALLAASLKRREIRFAMAASPCLSPYVLLHGWSGALAALIGAPLEFVAAWVGLWVLVGIRAAGITLG